MKDFSESRQGERKGSKSEGFEAMSERAVSILGAQGNLGRNLLRLLERIKPVNVRIFPSVDKIHNAQLTTVSDLVILTVRPDDIEPLLKEIASVLKPDAQIISFAAHTSLSTVSDTVQRPAPRFMADPWGNISAFFATRDFSREGLEFLFDNLTKEKPRELHSDAEIDSFTLQIAYLFAVLFLRKMDEIRNAEPHLEFLSNKLGVPVEDFYTFRMEDDPRRSLEIFATKGGVTERVIAALRDTPDIRPQDLFDMILNR